MAISKSRRPGRAIDRSRSSSSEPEATASFRALLGARSLLASGSHHCRRRALPRRAFVVPADPRSLDASLGLVDVVDRPCAGAPIAATRRTLVGQAQAKAARPVDQRKEGRICIRPLRHWVMVGCLQGKTRASCPYKVKNWLTAELVLDLTAND